MRLRLLRNKEDFSQDYVSVKVGCDVRTLYRWEQGVSYPMPFFKKGLEKIFPNLFPRVYEKTKAKGLKKIRKMKKKA